MSRWWIALAVASLVALAAPRAQAQVFKPRNGSAAKGTPTKPAVASKPADKSSDKPAEKPAVAKKRPVAAAKKPKKHKKSDDDDDTVTVEDDDVKISDD
ncbi:MAG TPA: hypothetical protein VGC42_13250 [Kofleriaceae bacterium]